MILAFYTRSGGCLEQGGLYIKGELRKERPMAKEPTAENAALQEAEISAAPDLPPAAQRALAEAAERRKDAQKLELPPELGGRDGPEPVRYGDWEKKGIAVDF
jgi:hypothetical protein